MLDMEDVYISTRLNLAVKRETLRGVEQPEGRGREGDAGDRRFRQQGCFHVWGDMYVSLGAHSRPYE